MKTTVSHLQTSLLDYETGRNERMICIETVNGDLKYNYLLKWLDRFTEDGELIILDIPDQLIDDICDGYYSLIHSDPVISELAMKTIMWDEVDGKNNGYDEDHFRDLGENWLYYKPEDLADRIAIVRAYLLAYKVLKRRINKVKHLKIVQQYMANL